MAGRRKTGSDFANLATEVIPVAHDPDADPIDLVLPMGWDEAAGRAFVDRPAAACQIGECRRFQRAAAAAAAAAAANEKEGDE